MEGVTETDADGESVSDGVREGVTDGESV